MEQEQDGAAVTRGQNQLHVLPEDWAAVAAIAEPILDRLDAAPAAQLLVVANDAESAAGIAQRIAAAAVEHGWRTLGATDVRRSARVLRASPAQIIVGPPHVLIELMQSAALKLDVVRAVMLAWVDDLDAAGTGALEAVMSEVPKDAARVVLGSAATPALEQLVERYARRARRATPAASESGAPVSLSFVATNDASRLHALRRVLDALDPESAFIVVRGDAARESVESLVRSLGYGGDSSVVRVGERPDGVAAAMVLYELPAAEAELRALVATHPAARVIALVAPRQVAALRRLAGGTVTPLALPEAAARARTREQALRDELAAILAAGQYSRELLALEPLLADYDGVEIAAAALRLLESQRSAPRAQAAAAADAPPALTRLYVNVGATDNVRPGDLVGAITNEAGISKADLGRVDVRDRHSTVEVATPVANAVVAKLTGLTIRGRRVLARVDEDRGARPGGGGRGRDEGGRGGGGGDRRDRPPRPRRDDVRLGSRDRERRPKR